MPECINCGSYTKYRNGHCKRCYIENQKQETALKLKERRHEKVHLTRFPSHSELYRNLPKMQEDIVQAIYDGLGMTWEGYTFWGRHKTTHFTMRPEEKNWDIIIEILSTPDKKYADDSVKINFQLLVEYKSSTQEWGKQVDAFMRQINSRKKRTFTETVLMTFDPEFEQYRDVLGMCDIHLVVLPERLMNKMGLDK